MTSIADLIDKVRALIQDLVEALAPARPQVAVQPVRSDDERIFRA
jgi:tetrahydromethanopterin S-methyltransferase subunit B